MSQLLGQLNVEQGFVNFNCYCKFLRRALVPGGFMEGLLRFRPVYYFSA